MREARVADLDAADGLEAAKSALASCMAAVKDAESDLRYAHWRVETAVAQVLAAEADRVLAEAARLKDELDGARAILAFLQGSLEPGSPLRHRVMMALPPSPPGVLAPDYRSHPALAAWRDAREALMRDAACAVAELTGAYDLGGGTRVFAGARVFPMAAKRRRQRGRRGLDQENRYG